VFGSGNVYALVYRILSNYIPILRLLPTKQNRLIKEASLVIDEVTTKLVQDKLNKYAKGELDNNKDLLSNLIKSNHEEGLDESEKMDFNELKNQVNILKFLSLSFFLFF